MPLNMTFPEIEAKAEAMLRELRVNFLPTATFVFVMHESDWLAMGEPKTLANRKVYHYHMVPKGDIYCIPKELWRRRWREEWQYDQELKEQRDGETLDK
jgi:hypothetical protein